MNRSKSKGTATETAVTRYAQSNGFPHAERRALHGSLDRGDVLLCPGVVLEVKGGVTAETASDLLVERWLVETELERVNAGAAVALLVTKRAAVGSLRAGQWWAHLRLSTLAQITSSVPYPVGVPTGLRDRLLDTPVRMTFDDALRLLRAGGYGSPLKGAS